jgi:iron complex outermembrane receptor protein
MVHAGLRAGSLLTPLALSAQDRPPQPRDTLAVVRLSEVVITAPAAAPPTATTFTMSRVSVAEIESRPAASVAQLTTLIPAAHVQTNSRGESLVYLRNAGERQVAVLMDGALLNVPWDWRVDMSLVPAGMVGGVSIAKGVPPVEYGTNVLGGAVNLASRVYERTPHPVTEAEFSYGTERQLRTVLSHRASKGPLAYAGSVGYSSADGWSLPRGTNLPFSQSDPAIRTNTDSRIANAFGRLVYMLDNGTEFGLTVLHLDAEKGVAPESHRDPATSSVRFWRYPVWRSSKVIFSSEGTLGARTSWKGAAWASRFQQTIDQYTSAAYDSFEAREEDRDLTLGTRLVTQHQLGASAVKLALNALTSSHRQRDLDLLVDGSVAPGTFPTLAYRQHVVSAGVEYEHRPTNQFTITAGASYDAAFSPKTGDKPPHDPFTDFSATLGASLDPGGPAFIRAALGRKTRFPTMRELFGEALDRFLLNPDLEPESSILTELAVGLRSGRVSGEIIPFGTFTSNTIDQRNVTLPGEIRPRRERINLKGSRVLGVEIAGAGQPHEDLRVEGHLTLMHVRRLQDDPADPTRLSEKPDALGRLAVSYTPVFGPRAQVETVYAGRAYSLDDNDQFVALARSLVLNARLGYRFELPDLRSLELFVYVANLGDQLVEPQLGLPASGRSLQGGVKADL